MTKNSQPPASSSGSTSATLKEVKAMQRERRLREKEQAKAQRLSLIHISEPTRPY